MALNAEDRSEIRFSFKFGLLPALLLLAFFFFIPESWQKAEAGIFGLLLMGYMALFGWVPLLTALFYLFYFVGELLGRALGLNRLQDWRITKVFRERWNRWKRALRERRIKKLTEHAERLQEGKEYDLLFLHKRGFVEARALGNSITQIHGEVESFVHRNLNVVIKPGTYFVARGRYQNMVTRAEYKLAIPPLATRSISVNAACINADRPIPDRNDRFSGVKRVSDDLARFLEASQQADPMAVQAGVWTLTNRYSRNDVQNRLIARDQFGNTCRAVSDAHVAEAKRILDSLGIRHRL